jgi:hypothetical protein
MALFAKGHTLKEHLCLTEEEAAYSIMPIQKEMPTIEMESVATKT